MAGSDPWAAFNPKPIDLSQPTATAGAPQPVFTVPDPRGDAEQARKDDAEVRANADAVRAEETLRLAKEKATRDADPSTSASVEERKAGSFLLRALGANDQFEAQHIGARSLIGQKIADNTPNFLNSLPESVGNSPERQVADQAQREFIAATLRQDSGAAIPDPEIINQQRIYFPQPGDGPKVIEAKRQSRLRAIEGLKEASGRMAPQVLAGFHGQTPPEQRAREPEMAGGVPAGSDIKFGMDGDGPQGGFDRNDWLKKMGLDPNEEAEIVAFWNANRGNKDFTVPQAKKWFADRGFGTVSEENLASAVRDARKGATFTAMDSAAAKAAYEAKLDAESKRRGFDPVSADAALGQLAQGATLANSDELTGALSAVGAGLQGENPVDAYTLARDLERRQLEQSSEAMPKTALALDLVGGLAAPFGMVGKGAKAAEYVKAGAKAGAVAGFGGGDGLIDSTVGAVGGAAVGAGVGKVVGKGAEWLAARKAARGEVVAGVAPDAPAPGGSIGQPSQLNIPRNPTPQEMNGLSSVESVPLSQARLGNRLEMDRFNRGDYGKPLVPGFTDKPIAVKLENGEYILLDGNHRAAKAAGQGVSRMDMHVIPAKSYDPANAGRASRPQSKAELDNLRAALGGETPRETPAAPLTNTEQTEIADLAKKATGWGLGARKARKELARKAAANPEAKVAAERLGVDLPSDILSDDAQLQSLTGLARSEVGSEAETGWRATTANVANQSEQALADLGASPDLAQLSDDVLTRLNGTAESLKRQAGALRDEVTAAVPPGERVSASNLEEVVAKMIGDYGGLAEAKAAMTGPERDLLKMLGEGEEAVKPTYARLNRLRSDIGDALEKNKGPWADVGRKELGDYYKALASDQLAAVEQVGGAELADKQRGANSLFVKMFDQRREMQELFGKNLEKGLAPLLKRSLTTGAKGDAKDLTLLLDRVPEDARGGAMLSAVMSLARTSASHGGFSFANYAKLYRGLRENAPVYAKIAKAVGPGAEQVLRDLFEISNRMAAGETKVLKTGKANQALASAMNAESIVGSVMSAAGGRAGVAMGSAAGGAVGGPVGAAAGATMANATRQAVSGAGKSRLDKVHGLLTSPQFRETIDKIAAGEDATAAAEGLWNSVAFHRFAKSVGAVKGESRRALLKSIISTGAEKASAAVETVPAAVPMRAAADGPQSEDRTTKTGAGQ